MSTTTNTESSAVTTGDQGAIDDFTIIVTREEFDRFLDALERTPEPNAKLIELMRGSAPKASNHQSAPSSAEEGVVS